MIRQSNFDVNTVRAQFPALNQKVGENPLIYMDNAASTLRCKGMIQRTDEYYSKEASNVHRGAHFLSRQATDAYEQARVTVQNFLGARSSNEIIFTKGTTESINLVAETYGSQLQAGDEVLLTVAEHHSNIVPWQVAAQKYGFEIKFVPLNQNFELDLDTFHLLLSERTKLVSLVWVSNVLGTDFPVQEVIHSCKRVGAKVLLDAAQAVVYHQINVQQLDCDFLVFSGHKIFGPNGTGVLFGKEALLNSLPPYQGGGSMIAKVTTEGSTFLSSPFRFEAGTPNVAGVLGLAAALDYFISLPFHEVQSHLASLTAYMQMQLLAVNGLSLYGSPKNKHGIFCFNIEGLHSSDIGQLLDFEGVAIRTGHHCTQPLWGSLGQTGAARASLAMYNTHSEIDRLILALKKAKEFAT